MTKTEKSDFEVRRTEVREEKDFISSIVQNEVLSDNQKIIHLLSIIAEQSVETNFWLEEVKNELFEHTLALDAIKPD